MALVSLLFREEAPGPPYGARGPQAVVVGDLLMRHVPELASGEIEIVAIARQPGELSKVAVRRKLGILPRVGRAVPLVLGRAGHRILAVKHALGEEQVDVVQWHAEPGEYLARALGLSYRPPVWLEPLQRRAEVLLGEIDYLAARNPRNVLLASALTGWHISVRQIAASSGWRALRLAKKERRSVSAAVVGRAPRGLRLEVYGLPALLPIGQIAGVCRETPMQVVETRIQERLQKSMLVKVLRLNEDEGRIIVSEQPPRGRQPRLF